MVTSKRSRLASMSLLAMILAVVGCDRQSSDPDVPAALSWTQGLPSAELPAAETMVWAAVPRADGTVRFGAYKMAEGALADDLGTLFPEVPAALVRPRADSSPERGEAVLALLPGGDFVLGRASAEGGVKTVINGRVVDVQALAMETLDADKQTFAPVAYRDDIGWQRGLALAWSASEVWLHTPDGRVEKRAAETVHRLDPAGDLEVADLKAGDAVTVGSWARGFEQATVVEILEPGVAFTVEIDGRQSIASYGDVIPSRPSWMEAG